MSSPTRNRLCALALVLALAVACRASSEQRITPTPDAIVRAGEVYTCSNGLEGCRVTYEIGPVTRTEAGLRVEFRVTLDGPAGGTTSWTGDGAMHAHMREQGQRGIGLFREADAGEFYELVDTGGIASSDVTLVAPVSYQGFWVFEASEPAGTELLLSYPDFIDRPAPIVVPE